LLLFAIHECSATVGGKDTITFALIAFAAVAVFIFVIVHTVVNYFFNISLTK